MDTNLHTAVPSVYAAGPDYAHAIEVVGARRLLFVAGTMGLDANGTAPPAVDAQLESIWDNLRAILGAAGMTVDDVVRVTSYLTDRAQAEANAAARVAALRGRTVPTTAIVVETLQDDWLVEIEVIAAS